MAYIDQSRRASPASMAAVVAVHAGVAAILVAGLAVSGVIPEDRRIIDTWDIPDTPPPPPVPDEVPPEPSEPALTDPYVPPLPLPLPSTDNAIDTTIVLPPPGPVIRDPRPMPDPGLIAPPSLGFDPVAAKPRNDPGGWLTNADYRSSWIRRELVGTARFRLEVSASGRVTSCRIVGSTGHSELDEATCALVTRRARFEPARGSEGQPVPGSYSNAVRWVLPE